MNYLLKLLNDLYKAPSYQEFFPVEGDAAYFEDDFVHHCVQYILATQTI